MIDEVNNASTSAASRETMLIEPGWRGGDGSLLRGFLLVTLLFLGTRFVVWTGAYTGSVMWARIDERLEPPYDVIRARMDRPENAELRDRVAKRMQKGLAEFRPLLLWDGNHYRSIIEGGYQYEPPPPDADIRSDESFRHNIAFFPLYPLICRLVAQWMSVPDAMVLVANLLLLFSAWLVFAWIRTRVGFETALLSAAILACWPSACFYSFGYAESTTLLFTTLTLISIDTRRYALGAVACALCTATRPTACVVAALLALCYYLREPGSQRKRAGVAILLGAIGGIGLFAYMGFLTWKFGSPFVYTQNFKGWVDDRARGDWVEYLTLARVWEQLKHLPLGLWFAPEGLVAFARPLAWNMWLNLFLVIGSFVAMRRVAPDFRPLLWFAPFVFAFSYAASGAASFGVQPIGRYMAISVPTFVAMAAWMREWKWGYRAAAFSLMMLIQAAWAFSFGLYEWSG
ncbi:MAG: hypothetical protein KDA32_00860 [Phycisphaerales bacterium]|nr:hypothetical protein [Phycisphaerales bacterium]